MTNSVMASGMPKVRGIRRGLYVLSYLIFFWIIIGGAYAYAQTKNYESRIQKEQEAIAVLDNDIAVAMKDERYVKYSAAKYIVTNTSVAGWWDRLSRIMNIFAKLQQLGGPNVRFSNFSLGFDSLSLQGTVNDLKLMYGKGGIIDQFNALEFLKNISIPDYKKTDDGFTFSLVADVVIQNDTK